MDQKGAFIVIEGLDGSGKTTQAKLLTAKLKKNHSAVYTAEPSQGKIGKFIRSKILYGESRPSISLEALMFAADRIDHLENEVLPQIKSGSIIICDRYIYSSLAYQGSAGLSQKWIEAINEHALRPDFALFIDVSPERVIARLKRKKSVMENLSTQYKVREIYFRYVNNGALTLIDGDKPKKVVAKSVFETVDSFLKNRN
jgi:dTMP kinase